MEKRSQSPKLDNKDQQQLLNKTFYQFVFSFITVIAVVLVLVLILGAQVTL